MAFDADTHTDADTHMDTHTDADADTDADTGTDTDTVDPNRRNLLPMCLIRPVTHQADQTWLRPSPASLPGREGGRRPPLLDTRLARVDREVTQQ